MASTKRILYHVTSHKNLHEILEFGLIPKYCKGLSCHPDTRPSYVWLTDNPNFILEKQAGANWCKRNNPIILQIDTNKLTISQHIGHDGTLAPHEFYTWGCIPPSMIKLHETYKK